MQLSCDIWYQGEYDWKYVAQFWLFSNEKRIVRDKYNLQGQNQNHVNFHL